MCADLLENTFSIEKSCVSPRAISVRLVFMDPLGMGCELETRNGTY